MSYALAYFSQTLSVTSIALQNRSGTVTATNMAAVLQAAGLATP